MKIKAEDDNKFINIKFEFGAFIYISYYNKFYIYKCIYINLQNINKIFFNLKLQLFIRTLYIEK